MMSVISFKSKELIKNAYCFTYFRFMRAYLSIIILVLMTFSFAMAQDDIAKYNEYQMIKRDASLKGMKVLRYWGLGNLGVGVVGALNSQGSQQYFHLMNSFWGGANVLISSFAIRSIRREEFTDDFLRLELSQKKIERTFLINSGLDVLYTGAGFAMLNYSNSPEVQKERMEGYAYSFIMQGAFLFILDTSLYFIHKKNRKKRLEKSVGSDGYYNE